MAATLVVLPIGVLDSHDNVAAAETWESVVPGGDCECSDGSEFGFWLREQSQDRVVLYLEDGGACFSAETCDPGSDLYQVAVGEGPTAEQGIFDLEDDRNPLAEYSMLYVPYCTADVHLGDVVTEYADGLTVRHRGLANGTAALDHLAAQFPDATDIVVIGESAGSVAAPLYGGLVADRFPDARITVLADGSGAFPDESAFNRVLEVWDVAGAVPAWAERLAAGTALSVPGLFALSERHHPELRFARLDYVDDPRQAMWFEVLDVPTGGLGERIAANEALIEQQGVNVATDLAPGANHTMLSENEFYTLEVAGQPLVDWVARLVSGAEVDDVRCTECAGPEAT